MSSKTKCFHAISADNFAFTRQMDIFAEYPQNTTSVVKGNRGHFVWLSGVLSQQLNTIRQKYNISELDIPNDSGTICGLREKNGIFSDLYVSNLANLRTFEFILEAKY